MSTSTVARTPAGVLVAVPRLRPLRKRKTGGPRSEPGFVKGLRDFARMQSLPNQGQGLKKRPKLPRRGKKSKLHP